MEKINQLQQTIESYYLTKYELDTDQLIETLNFIAYLTLEAIEADYNNIAINDALCCIQDIINEIQILN